jgi:hypothetical protein
MKPRFFSIASIARMATIASLAVSMSFGCSNGNYGSAVITDQVGDPAARIDFHTGISVPEGSVVSANIQLVAVDGDDMTGSLESRDPDILEITQSAGSSNNYVFLGVSQGTTSVLVMANGVQVGTLSAVVVPPPASSVLELPEDGGVTGESDGGLFGDATDDDGSTGILPVCNKTCEMSCAGAPGCIQACGC